MAMRISDYKVVIPALFMCFSLPVDAQQRIVTGTVTSGENGEPLPGVSVTVKGEAEGAATGPDGKYSIPVRSQEGILVFTFLGFTSQETSVSGRPVIDVVLQANVQQLNEVVAIGYGIVKRADVTGSVASVQAAELEKRQVTSVDQALQGKASGVQVIQNNGAPGGTITLRIRGSNSIMGGNEPLYVVDGVPVTSGHSGNSNILSTINPADIKTIDILKDASSAAIYGARGANGVVLITTKSGAEHTSRLDFDYSFGIQDVIKRIKMANARQFAELVNERAANDNEGFVPYPDQDNLPYDTDWQREIYRVAPVHNYSLSYSGGTDKTRYFVSGNYFDQDGLMPNTNFRRYSTRVNLNSEISDRFSLGTQFQLSQTNGSRTATENDNYNLMLSILGGAPTAPVYNEDGSYGDPFPVYFTENYDNPMAMLKEMMDQLTTQRLIGNVNATYDILEGLDFTFRAGIDRLTMENDGYINSILSWGQPNGRASKSYSKSTTLLIENLLHYRRAHGDHRFDLVAGNTLQSGETTSFGASSQDFLTDYFSNNNLGAGASFNQPSSDLTRWALNSWIGRVNYSFKEKYLLTLTGRADGSSRFGKGNKWGWFPSAALAWQLGNESFMDPVHFISDAKLRLSWGVTGNQEIGLYQSLQQINPVVLGIGNGTAVGFAPGNIANDRLRWEQTDQYNFGLDMGLWNSRISFTIDYYIKNTRDLLALVELPPSSGFGSSTQNVGSIRNKGLELSLHARLISRSDFSWDLTANWSANRNKVTSLAGGNDVFGVNARGVIRVGEPLANFYDYVMEGIDANTGAVVYKDLDGNGVVNSLDRQIIGYAEPDFIYGLTNNITFRQFDLSVFIQGVQGNDVYDESFFQLANSMIRARNQVLDVYNHRWKPGDDNTNAKYPRISVANTILGAGGFAVEDGSYLRLKNVRLAYRFKTGTINFVKNASVYLAVQNLFTLTAYRWVDPDVSSYGTSNVAQGVDRLSYPTSKIYTMGLQFSF